MNTDNCLGDPVVTEAAEKRFWPVNWSGVFVGSLAALATALIAGLASVAIGTQMVGHGEHVVSWNKVHFGGIIWTVCSAFFSFVVGGWVAGKITGYSRPESTMLHGAIAWLVTIPFILLFAALGAGGYFGAWYTGLAGTPIWSTSTVVLPVADAANIVRNNALGALTALVLGLIGSVLGGWMAAGQPMVIGWGGKRTEPFSTNTVRHSEATVVHTP